METAYCVEAERSMSRVLGGSCQVPLGAFAEIIDGTLQLRGFVAQPDGTRIVSDALNGKPETGIKMGQELAEKLIKQGADEILASLVPAEGWK
jgi:hydroxymethylbilane synthase